MDIRNNLIIQLSLLILLSFNVNAKQPYWVNPELILSEISVGKGISVLNEIFHNPESWSYVNNKIELGNEEWIKVALELKKIAELVGSVGGSCGLHDSMFGAIKNNPLYILKNNLNLCEGRHDPLSNYKDAMHEVEQTKNALNRIKNEELQYDIESCLKMLNKSKRDLKRFFEIRE